MKCPTLYSGKDKKNINMLTAEFTQRVLIKYIQVPMAFKAFSKRVDFLHQGCAIGRLLSRPDQYQKVQDFQLRTLWKLQVHSYSLIHFSLETSQKGNWQTVQT